MKVDLYERIWMYIVVLMLALFFTSTAIAAVKGGIHPPSHVETIHPKTVFADARFTPQGVSVDPQGHVHAKVVGMMFAWLPATMTIPAGTPVTFHITSMDVQHGYQIIGTNGQSMVLPGYVSQFTTEFDPGEYLVACNEYCGVGHHTMASRLRVVPRAQWTAPAATSAPALPTTTAGGSHDVH
jgi:cytochrome c oxidase subunit 2